MRIAEVALRASDLERSVAFYKEMLGFTFHKEEAGAVFLEVGPLDTPLGAAGHPQLLAIFGRGNPIDPATSTFDHIAFEVQPEEYEAHLARFQAADMVIRERAWPDSLLWDGRSFFFRDPDGNVVEIISANRG